MRHEHLVPLATEDALFALSAKVDALTAAVNSIAPSISSQELAAALSNYYTKSNLDILLQGYLLLSGGQMSGNIDMGGHYITNTGTGEPT